MTSLNSAVKYEGCAGFRQRVALSAISQKAVEIRNIRLNCEQPGIEPYEACILELLENMSEGVKMRVSESDVVVNPGMLVGREHAVAVTCPPQRGLAYYLEFLAMICPFAKHASTIILEGVTDHPRDLAIDSFRAGLTTYAKKLGLPEMTVNVERRGMLPLGGGRVVFSCAVAKLIQPGKLLYGGRVARIRGVAWSCHMSALYASRTVHAARFLLNDLLADVHIYTEPAKSDQAGNSPGFGISLVAETMTGAVFTADALVDKTAPGTAAPGTATPATATPATATATPATAGSVKEKAERGKAAKAKSRSKHEPASLEALIEAADEEENMAAAVAAAAPDEPEVLYDKSDFCEQAGKLAAMKLICEIASGSAVDCAFQWLPLYFFALADDFEESKVVIGRITPNTVLLLRHLKDFLDVSYYIQPYAKAMQDGKQALARQREADQGAPRPDLNSDDENWGKDPPLTGPHSTDDQPPTSHSPADDPVVHNVPPPNQDHRKNPLYKHQQDSRFVLTCKGVGLANLQRITF